MSGRSRPPADLLRSGPEPPKPPRRARSRRIELIAGLALVAVGGTVGVIVSRDGGDGPAGISFPGIGRGTTEETLPASGVFPGESGVKGDGRDQELSAAAVSGQTVVAVGGDRDPQGGGGRALFVVSTDNGHTWTASSVPGTGSPPRWVAGTSGGWLAGAADGTLWTSPDGATWKRGPDGAAKVFGAADRIIGAASSPQGWIAVGMTPAEGPLKATPVMWTSADGSAWKRLSPGEFALPAADELVALTKVYPGGSGITVEGVRMKHLEKSPSRRDVVWTTDNGGRSWNVQSKTGSTTVPRPDSAFSLIPGPQPGAVTATVGRVKDGPDLDPTLTVDDGSGRQRPVALAELPGVLSRDLTIAALAATPGLRVATGSRDGRPQLWTSADGRAWDRATLPGAPERGRLTAVTSGPAGWVAAGPGLLYTSPDGRTWTRSDTPPSRPLLAAGPAGYLLLDVATLWRGDDLKTWNKTQFGDGTVHALSAGPHGYTAVGNLAGRPTTWSSPDGETWTAIEPPAPAGTALTHVAASADLVVAAGNAADRPLAFTSSDRGRTWLQSALPGAPATLTTLIATGKTWFATGTRDGEVLTWTSDDGRTWQAAQPQGPGLSGPGDQRVTTVARLDDVLTTITVSDTVDPYVWIPAKGT